MNICHICKNPRQKHNINMMYKCQNVYVCYLLVSKMIFMGKIRLTMFLILTRKIVEYYMIKY